MLDVERLRRNLEDECMGAYFGGFGPALVEYSDIVHASPEDLVEIAQRLGKNVLDYEE